MKRSDRELARYWKRENARNRIARKLAMPEDVSATPGVLREFAELKLRAAFRAGATPRPPRAGTKRAPSAAHKPKHGTVQSGNIRTVESFRVTYTRVEIK